MFWRELRSWGYLKSLYKRELRSYLQVSNHILEGVSPIKKCGCSIAILLTLPKGTKLHPWKLRWFTWKSQFLERKNHDLLGSMLVFGDVTWLNAKSTIWIRISYWNGDFPADFRGVKEKSASNTNQRSLNDPFWGASNVLHMFFGSFVLGISLEKKQWHWCPGCFHVSWPLIGDNQGP